MSGLQCLASENIWFDKQRYDEAEKCFYEGANGPSTQGKEVNAILQDIAKSRQNILQSLNRVNTVLQISLKHTHCSSRTAWEHCMAETDSLAVCLLLLGVDDFNQLLHKVVEEMRAALQKLESRVAMLEKSPAAVPCAKSAPVKAAPVKPVKVENGDDDDIDLFGSDEDDEEAARLKQERVDAYAAKKSKKPALIAKSSILLDVKPWDDETDMVKLEECVRSVQMDGLLWGQSKLVPVGYGIKKLQINCVVEDDKVGTDILEEEITKFEDYIQSVDVAAFNKI
ncbi:elongation factor 1-delta [Etheostoma spectabile]|uniref:elongation factor 1-delta n=1 Tax=Etheostoma spectabile TaxID=54343 RepID=UPI0013AFA309|nr:elongation factor 1-delta-like [Etheostoma spectabile]